MIRGSCLCSGVAWEVSKPFINFGHCHCSMCRKAHGAAFNSTASAPVDGFAWVRGQDLVRGYETSPGSQRPFCSRCGSVVPGGPGAGRMFVPAGSLDDDPGMRPAGHIFVASKAPWHEITDDLPRYDEYPPEIPAEAIKWRREPPGPEGTVRGSCLCAGVAYELQGDLQLIGNCHCSRCRKISGAAHASTLFSRLEQFRWLRGDDLSERYKLPEAERFVTRFCRTCGSRLPRMDPEFEFVSIPAGTLDDDPGARERIHIFVASKAPWHEITDDLPQFEEGPPGTP